MWNGPVKDRGQDQASTVPTLPTVGSAGEPEARAVLRQRP